MTTYEKGMLIMSAIIMFGNLANLLVNLFGR